MLVFRFNSSQLPAFLELPPLFEFGSRLTFLCFDLLGFFANRIWIDSLNQFLHLR